MTKHSNASRRDIVFIGMHLHVGVVATGVEVIVTESIDALYFWVQRMPDFEAHLMNSVEIHKHLLMNPNWASLTK